MNIKPIIILSLLLFFLRDTKGQTTAEKIETVLNQDSIRPDVVKKNIVKINILSPFIKSGSLFYERACGKRSSLQLGVYVIKVKIDNFDQAKTINTRFTSKWSGFGVTPEYRYHLSKKRKGLYLSTYIRFQKLSNNEIDFYHLKPQESKSTLTTFGGGFLFGHHWIIKKRLSIDAFIGPRYNWGNPRIEYGYLGRGRPSYSEYFTGALLRTGITAGVAF